MAPRVPPLGPLSSFRSLFQQGGNAGADANTTTTDADSCFVCFALWFWTGLKGNQKENPLLWHATGPGISPGLVLALMTPETNN